MSNPPILLPSSPLLLPSSRLRSPSRSPTRIRFTDDLLKDLSPATTLEAFTSQSGKLKVSIEAATELQRAFGIRAALASKKIAEWLSEIKTWPWPKDGGSKGFEQAVITETRPRHVFSDAGKSMDYSGSLPFQVVQNYAGRLEEIRDDMEELQVEDIKRQVLDSHFTAASRPSSSSSSMTVTDMRIHAHVDDFTAVITATVLQMLPELSKLLRLLDDWAVRISILERIPKMLSKMEQTEHTLEKAWHSIMAPTPTSLTSCIDMTMATQGTGFSREEFDMQRETLQARVTSLGHEIDYMLDTLEGRHETLPEQWLDRMETIEKM